MAANDHARMLQSLGLVDDDWQCDVQFVDLLLEQKRADVAIVNACEEIYDSLVVDRIRNDVCCAPLAEVENARKIVARREWINARVDKVTAVDGSKFIQKHDEQRCADQLSFVANVLQCRLGLSAPRMALVQRDNGTTMQSIEYLPDFRPLHDARSEVRKEVRTVKSDFVGKLAAVLAFAFFVADFDNFVFIGRYVDNFHFLSRDNSFEPWTYFYDSPVINGGNLGTTENDFVLLDIRPSSDAEYRQTAHDVVRGNAKPIAQMVGQYFKFGQAETQYFESSLSQHFEQYMHYDSLLNELVDWAIESCY
jgi:hypothetical protein